MNREQIKMKKRIEALKANGTELFTEVKKTEVTSQKNTNKNAKYKNLWAPSEKTKKQEDTPEGFKFGDTLPLR